ncbi:MAG: putative mucin/carbohydrate-binding domain-containing protein [Clostridium botulinum]|uniref:putative mucin/carbohydrate-binding domain-containing protein n=1 Tax=uncultured Clostridium sp. TaxID=59620 RepID=UPI00280BCE76|nr:putative mucin/carbohydrate-binding domain-containing protein [uncultured Clostridium sp.]MDU6877912.1 putative mucin/carbohydrate-binding domain-containing protein [Clostridium botulinum]
MKKKALIIGIINLLIVFGIVNVDTKLVYAYTNATGMYVNPVNEKKADIMTVDWSTTKNAPNTYWAVHNWNAGGEAGGYAGFQQRPDRRTLHFAIWDPISARQPIKAEYLSSSSTSSRFGGEGEGMKVETNYDWKPASWYKMTMRNWQEDGHTKFGQWIRDESTKEWKQIAVLDFPVANVNFNWGTGMFQEDWAGNGQDVRNARLKNFYSRSVSNQHWNSLYQQRIKSQYPEKNWNGGGNSEYVWVEAGGNTKPSMTSGQIFNINQPSKPDVGTLDFDIINAKYENNSLNISWKLKNQSTPQFKGKIEIYNNPSMIGTPIKTINNIKSYENSIKKSCQLVSLTGLYAKVVITDLFDNTITKTVTLTGNNEGNYKGSNFNFDFKGYSDRQFAKLDLNLDKLTSKLTVQNIKTHYYFNDSYASILIQDKNGQTVFYKDFIGNKVNDAMVKDIPLKEGYYLTVKHREYSNRLFLTNVDKNLALDKGATNTYKISKNQLNPISENEIPNPNKSPYVGKHFDFIFKGLGDWIFGQLNLDLSSNEAKIDITKGKPHIYFKDSYASLLIKDNEGNIVYTKDFIGDKSNEDLVKNIPVKTGYYIILNHQESKDRLIVTNLDNKLELEKDNNTNYKITDSGLLKVSKGEIPNPSKPIYYGTEFDTLFKGYADRVFAKMKIDLSKRQATITTNSGIPHSYFNEYATILIQNSKKETVYSKNFIGTYNYYSNNETVSVEEGSIITITHLESKDRLKIINTENLSELEKANSVTYQVMNGGLKKIS